MRINLELLHYDILEAERELRALKELFREPGQPRVEGASGWRRKRLRDWATKLYSIRAHARGRIHLARRFSSLEEQAALIEKSRKAYEAKPAEEAA
jgi:hypothetical protein